MAQSEHDQSLIVPAFTAQLRLRLNGPDGEARAEDLEKRIGEDRAAALIFGEEPSYVEFVHAKLVTGSLAASFLPPGFEPESDLDVRASELSFHTDRLEEADQAEIRSGLDALLQWARQRAGVLSVMAFALFAGGIGFGVGWTGQQAAHEAQMAAAEANQVTGRLVAVIAESAPEAFSEAALIDMDAALRAQLSDAAGMDRDDRLLQAGVLRSLGEIDNSRGDRMAARADYAAAVAITGALLDADPSDPDLVFEHAQSVFYVASTDYQAGEFAQAVTGYEAYARLADRLAQLEPGAPRSIGELGYAALNLGVADHAVGAFEDALAHFLDAEDLLAQADAAGAETVSVFDQANAIAWAADAALAARQINTSIDARSRQLALYAGLDQSPSVQITTLTVHHRRAGAHAAAGAIDLAAADTEAGLVLAERLRRDGRGDNRRVRNAYAQLLQQRADQALWTDDAIRAALLADRALALMAHEGQGETSRYRPRDIAALQILRAQAARSLGDEASAAALATLAISRLSAAQPDGFTAQSLARAHLILGDSLAARDDVVGAQDAWRAGLAAVRDQAGRDLGADDVIARLAFRLGAVEIAAAAQARLAEAGYAHPSYLAFWAGEDNLVFNLEGDR